MIGYLFYDKHFSFNNINALCNQVPWVEISWDRQLCYQCKAIMRNPCDHDDYYCLQCKNRDIKIIIPNTYFPGKFTTSWISRKCHIHVEFIHINSFFNVHRACLKCYRELTENYTDRNMLPPADFSKYLPLENNT